MRKKVIGGAVAVAAVGLVVLGLLALVLPNMTANIPHFSADDSITAIEANVDVGTGRGNERIELRGADKERLVDILNGIEDRKPDRIPRDMGGGIVLVLEVVTDDTPLVIRLIIGSINRDTQIRIQEEGRLDREAAIGPEYSLELIDMIGRIYDLGE